MKEAKHYIDDAKRESIKWEDVCCKPYNGQ
jgi:hypothetical protein